MKKGNLIVVIPLPPRGSPMCCSSSCSCFPPKRRFDNLSATLAETVEVDEEEKADESQKKDEEEEKEEAEAGVAEEHVDGEEASKKQEEGGEKENDDESGKTDVVTEAGDGSAAALVAAAGEGVEEGAAGETTVVPVEGPKRPYGKEWLKTHPRGTPPTLKLAIQFDQVRCMSLFGVCRVRSEFVRFFAMFLLSLLGDYCAGGLECTLE